MLNATFYSTQNFGWDFSLAHYVGNKIPLNWYRLWNMSCLLRLLTPFPSSFKALFFNRDILRALNDAIVIPAGRCHLGHINANRVHAHWSACTLVAATQDVALHRAAAGIGKIYKPCFIIYCYYIIIDILPLLKLCVICHFLQFTSLFLKLQIYFI